MKVVSKMGETPLYLAAAHGKKKVVELLLDNRADKEKQKNNGATPLYIAAQNGHTDTVTLLLAAWG